jgi:1,4-dihydroxy-2-naphthoyl-CoA hydrolase
VSIWFQKPSLEMVNSLSKGTMLETIGIEFTGIGDDYIEGTMPADHRTFQPYQLVHGGANVVLAESLGSTGGALTLDPDKYYCVGQEVNANHLRAVRSGLVTGRAERIYGGRSSQVWQIRLWDDQGKLSCISRLTLAIVKK